MYTPPARGLRRRTILLASIKIAFEQGLPTTSQADPALICKAVPKSQINKTNITATIVLVIILIMTFLVYP